MEIVLVLGKEDELVDKLGTLVLGIVAAISFGAVTSCGIAASDGAAICCGTAVSAASDGAAVCCSTATSAHCDDVDICCFMAVSTNSGSGAFPNCEVVSTFRGAAVLAGADLRSDAVSTRTAERLSGVVGGACFGGIGGGSGNGTS